MKRTDDFRYIYCTHHSIPLEAYTDHILKKALHPPARFFRILLRLGCEDYFRADLDFIHDVGCLRRFRDYDQCVHDFVSNPWNHDNLFRNVFGLRVSTTRVRRLLRELLKSSPGGSRAPMPASANLTAA